MVLALSGDFEKKKKRKKPYALLKGFIIPTLLATALVVWELALAY